MAGKKPKIGVALGTGAARGLAHLGVLKALMHEGIQIDCLAGTSMGALVAGCVAAGIPIEKLEKLACDINPKQVRKYFKPSFTRHGLAHGKTVEDVLRDIIGNITFDQLKIPLWVMGTDLVSGKEVVLNQGEVVKAVRASISLPVIFTPVKKENMLLVDGGLVDPIPAGLLTKMGADIIIAVDVTRDIEKSIKMGLKTKFAKSRSFFSKWRRGKGEKDQDMTPGMFQVLLQTIKVMEAKIAELQLSEERVDVLIKPALDHIFFLEFRRARELIDLGENAAMDALPIIRQKIRQFEAQH